MRELVRGHVDGVLPGPVPAVVDLNVFERERARVRVGAEYAVRGAVVHDRVAHGDVVRVVVYAAEGAARDVEALEDVVVREAELYRVRPAGDYGAQAVHANAPYGYLARAGPGAREDHVARVGRVAVDLHHVAGVEDGCDRLKVGER